MPPEEPAAIVARYTATVSTGLVRSDVTIGRALDARVFSAMVADPGFVPWPPPLLGDRELVVGDVVDQAVILLRFKAAFDFGADVGGRSADQLSQLIDERWPSLATARAASGGDADESAYTSYDVDAELDEAGDCTWGYTSSANGGRSLRLSRAVRDNKRSELDIFLQNVVSLDLQRRAETCLA